MVPPTWPKACALESTAGEDAPASAGTAAGNLLVDLENPSVLLAEQHHGVDEHEEGAGSENSGPGEEEGDSEEEKQ